MELSDKGAAFIAEHEGIVTRAYRDPVGILTIGIGFTMRSSSFSAYWRRTRGHDLRPGDTITRQECFDLVRQLVAEEYGAAVNRKFGNRLQQHQFDAACSVTFNCGAGTLTDRWAVALARGDVAGAASLLRSTRITASGRRLQGLVNRRAEEARLLQLGLYGIDAPTRPSNYEVVLEAQKLLNRLIRETPLLTIRTPLLEDGDLGPKTSAATLEFQKIWNRSKIDPAEHLLEDGVPGRATLSALRKWFILQTPVRAVVPDSVEVDPASVPPPTVTPPEPARPPTNEPLLPDQTSPPVSSTLAKIAGGVGIGALLVIILGKIFGWF